MYHREKRDIIADMWESHNQQLSRALLQKMFDKFEVTIPCTPVSEPKDGLPKEPAFATVDVFLPVWQKGKMYSVLGENGEPENLRIPLQFFQEFCRTRLKETFVYLDVPLYNEPRAILKIKLKEYDQKTSGRFSAEILSEAEISDIEMKEIFTFEEIRGLYPKQT